MASRPFTKEMSRRHPPVGGIYGGHHGVLGLPMKFRRICEGREGDEQNSEKKDLKTELPNKKNVVYSPSERSEQTTPALPHYSIAGAMGNVGVAGVVIQSRRFGTRRVTEWNKTNFADLWNGGPIAGQSR